MRRSLLRVGLCAVVLGGCATPLGPAAYRTLPATSSRDRTAAREANERGLGFATTGRYDLAEKAFREALRSDVTFAAAHNNLGLVLLETRRFYEAALEFQFAGKLNPSASEPVINLARLYESLRWCEPAINQYEKALALDGDNVEVMGRLAYLYATAGHDSGAAENLLRQLLRDSGDDKWKAWAMAQLSERTTEATE